MNIFPLSVNKLIEEFQKMPGIGPKTASRLVVYYLGQEVKKLETLSKRIEEAVSSVKKCSICGNFCEKLICNICEDERRNISQILVVETPLDIIVFEESGVYSGTYHVLGGLVSPLNGIGPDNLNIASLEERVNNTLEDTNSLEIEIIFGLSQNFEGEATTSYIRDLIKDKGNKIQFSSLAKGLPTGSSVGYMDRRTIESALIGRK